jgi:YesN/AraC family two-component response regulator
MKRLLLVEDNRLERKILFYTLLKQLDSQVKIDEVSEGNTALSYLLNMKYDLVITDLIMPHVDGLELIMKIKKAHPECKIIAISGGKPFYLHIAKKMGVHSVFTKPVDNVRFLNTVKELLKIQNK